MSSRPSWQDTSLGTRARVGLWLLEMVGEGGVFSKAMLREAFPGVEQIDRRMRDLRPDGWVIRTAREDAALSLNELRFEAAGRAVWEPGSRKAGRLSAGDRAQVMAECGYRCIHCGISAGEQHWGDHRGRAQLVVVKASERNQAAEGSSGGGILEAYVTECDLCRAGAVVGLTSAQLESKASALTEAEKKELAEWVSAGRRQPSALDRVWADFVRMAPAERTAFSRNLRA